MNKREKAGGIKVGSNVKQPGSKCCQEKNGSLAESFP